MVTKDEYIRRRLQMLCATCYRKSRIKQKLHERLSPNATLEEFEMEYKRIIEEEI